MQINVSSNGYDVVAGGMAYLFEKDSDFTMTITADDNSCFSLVMKFEEDDAGGSSIENSIQGTTIFLTCRNFSESGTGLTEPIKIAAIAGKTLYLMFWSYLDGTEKDKKQVRSVRYTLYY